MKVFTCWTCNEFGHFSYTCPKRIKKNRKISLSDEDEEFKASMGRFLNDCDKDNLVKKEEVLEEIALVTTIDPKANHENVEVIISNDLQSGNHIEEKRSNPRAEEKVELRTPEHNGIVEIKNKSVVE